MTNSVSTLLSKIQYDRKQTQLTSANVARADVEGYTRKIAYAQKLILNDSVSGIKQSQITRVIDKVLQSQIRLQNSDLGKSSTLDNYYTNISQLLGTKGDNASFAHNLNQFSVKLEQVVSNTDGNKKSETIQQAVTLCNQLNQISGQINNLRKQTDQDLGTAIDSLNSMMTSMQKYNRQIVSFTVNNLDTTNLEDERDLVIHNAAELSGIKIYDGDYGNKTLALENGNIVATSSSTSPLTYTEASYVAPGDVLSPIINSAGVDITNTFNSGQISGLLKLRDVVLPNIQAELDELTRVLRDTTNALHNEASALQGDPTITGLNYTPGVALPLDGTTTISGQGTLRIGVTDTDGTLLDYKDVLLTDGMTPTSLITSITAAPYVNGIATGAFTVTQLATGELQITSTANKSLAIGAAGAVKPMISPTATYDATQAYGFSHFFGLNNLFDTGNQVASNTAQTGIANAITVRPKFLSNSNNLSVGRLATDIPAPTSSGLGLAASDTNVAREISDLLARGSLNFLPAGVLSIATISANEYATRIMTTITSEISASNSTLQISQRVYEELTKLAQDKSGVDPSEEIIRIFELSTSQNITSKALSIVNSMDKDLILTLAK